MTKPLVSTLICTYNAERFFSSTIESVLNQSYKNQEILIWDDCSKDSTLEILRKLEKKHKNIKVFSIKNKKLWPYWWLNYLLDRSKWKYIAIQDHDDIWHQDKIKIQISILELDHKIDACSSKRFIYDENHDLIYHDLDKNKYSYYHTSLVYKKTKNRYNKLLDKHNDNDFKKKYLNNIFIVEMPLCIHRIRKWSTNLSFKWTWKPDNSFLWIINNFTFKYLKPLWIFKNHFFSKKEFISKKNMAYDKILKYLK